MKYQTISDALGKRFLLPADVIRKILRTRRAAGVAPERARKIVQAAEEILDLDSQARLHVRRGERLGARVRVTMRFFLFSGHRIARAVGRTEDLSLRGALVGELRFLQGALPMVPHRMFLSLGAFAIEGRCVRLEMDDQVRIGVEFVGVDWETRKRLKPLLWGIQPHK